MMYVIYVTPDTTCVRILFIINWPADDHHQEVISAFFCARGKEENVLWWRGKKKVRLGTFFVVASAREWKGHGERRKNEAKIKMNW